MTTRKCPWCGGKNLRITNVMGESSGGHIYWEDRDCGYRERTGHGPNYEFRSFVEPKPRRKDYVKRVCTKDGLDKEK